MSDHLLFLGCCLFVVLVVLARGLHPVSFPNLEVKPFCADGTATGGLWESRALPTVSLSGPGNAGLFVGWCFPVFFFGGGGVWSLFEGRYPHHLFLFCLWCVWGVVVGAAPIFLCV